MSELTDDLIALAKSKKNLDAANLIFEAVRFIRIQEKLLQDERKLSGEYLEELNNANEHIAFIRELNQGRSCDGTTVE